MILATHAITGATLATLTPHNPILAFIIGFVSHFLLDAIPHLDYKLKSVRMDSQNPLNKEIVIDKTFHKDLMKIAIDGITGLILTFIIFKVFLGNNYSMFVIFVGAIAAMLPDALQFVYCKWKHEPLITLQRFHVFMHSDKKMGDKPFLGALSQVLVIVFFIIMLTIQ
jgi:hypothetical protein